MGLRSAWRRWRGRGEPVEVPAEEPGQPGAFLLPPARFIGEFRGTRQARNEVAQPGQDDDQVLEPGTIVLGAPPVSAPSATLDAESVAPSVAPPLTPAVAPRAAAPSAPRTVAPRAAAPVQRRPYDDLAPLEASGNYDPAALAEAWALVRERPDKLVLTFYAELFLRLDDAPSMFPSSLSRQRTEFGKAIVQWVAADDPDVLRVHLEQLGDDHRKFDVERHHYETAGRALLSAWRTTAGRAWKSRHEYAVLGSYARVAQTMLAGAKLHEHEPATWQARVVEHRQLHRDFAVLTVQPDDPYPYRAGQFLTLEAPSHRKEWRHMSIASAPRADNSFDLHVRVQGGSGVAAALVRDTGIGGLLTIGPPRGTALVVEAGMAAQGLLCIASGTGSAPINAVVESVLRWPAPPARIDVYVGGRAAADVYGVEILNDVIRDNDAWLRANAHAVLPEQSNHTGYRGRVEQLVPTLRDWAGLGVEVLVAGPDAMIQDTIDNLVLNRVPRERIHFDQFEVV